MNSLENLKRLLGFAPRVNRKQAMAAFAKRYASFKELLQANADLAGIMAQLAAAERGERSLDVNQLRKEVRRAIFECERMAVCLNAISGQRHKELENVATSLGKRIEKELEQHTRGDIHSLTLPLDAVDASMAYSVGGKSANLGELRNMLDMPVPNGFVVTIQAGMQHILRNDGLFKNIHMTLRAVDPEDAESIRRASSRVRELIIRAPVPGAVGSALLDAWDETFGERETVCALRSSALAEDGAQSFAGQYRTILGVTRDTLPTAFKQVIASLFSPRALTYRVNHGYSLEASGMGLCCLEMVNAKAAGVAFSRHPVDLRSNCVLINGLWGLGEMVVDGSGTPDQWLVSRASREISQEIIAHKTTRLVLVKRGDTLATEMTDVSETLCDVPCLTHDQVRQLASMVLDLERHYRYPQDMEWAVDENDQIVLLQTRPVRLDNAPVETSPELKHTHPLFTGADIATRGVGCGPVVVVREGDDLTHFPEGGVMLLKHSSPGAMAALQRADAVVAETGSLTGHMASLCREFSVPTLMNLPGVYNTLSSGSVVTVDALSGRIFAGEIPELLALRLKRRTPQVDSPALVIMRRVAPYIMPLHLIDPAAPTFQPAYCTSLHDVMRYAHELSYSEMFLLSDSLSESSDGGAAVRLICRVPLDLYIIDLGGGLKDPEALAAAPEDVTSLPLRTLLDGMLNPAVQARGPRPVNMRGFLSVMGRSMSGDNQRWGERFGDRSYAVVSDRYLNFSSRVGYHYAILDTWCGDTLSKNYIRFEFAGGGAGNEQRNRRVRCIGLILSELGFTVEVTDDRIRARYQKYPKNEQCCRLDQLGRLLIMTRQMDMLMVDEESVQIFATNFLNGNYH